MRRAALLLAAAAAVGVSGAAAFTAALSARVDILDSGIRPEAVRIDVGGKVTWTNKGRKPHAVVSLANTFRPFVLGPGRSKSVKFTKLRCERYSVDGQRQGRVLVGVSTCGGGVQPPPPSGLEEKVIRYDVKVVALLNTVETFTSNNPGYSGTTDRELNWTGTWPKHEVKVTTGFGSENILSVFAGQKRGTIRGTLEWSETRAAHGGPCSGEIAYAGKAQALLQGSKAKGSKMSVGFDASILNANAIDNLTRSRQEAACDGSSIGLPNWEDETDLFVQGVYIHHPPGFSIHPMDTRWSREGAPGTRPFPFDRIMARKGFTLDSGVRRSTRSEQGFRQTFTGRVRYVFTPVR